MTDRKVSSEEFKREAVRLAHERGNFRAAARELGISDSVLFRWRNQREEAPETAFPGQGNPRDPEKVQLEREVTRLREEVEILKKILCCQAVACAFAFCWFCHSASKSCRFLRTP
jgi:transposase